MHKNIYFFTELKLQRTYIDIPKHFFEKGFCEKENDKIKFKITGILISEKYIFVIFPKGVFSKVKEEQNIIITQTLIQVLLKYNKGSIEEHHINFGENNVNSNFLSLINWLVKNFHESGLLRKDFKKEQINSNGKINWNKTIKKTTPYIIENEILYLDTINIKSMSGLNNEVTLVHYNILKEIEKEYGWLLNFRIAKPLNLASIKYNYQKMKFILHNALRMTFNQKDIVLYQMLIKYIDSKITAKGKNDFIVLYTKYYQYIWEDICKELFDHKQILTNLLPKPYWAVGNEKQYSSQIPDILTSDSSNNLYIIDAKYYRSYEGIKYLPGSPDIIKQLFYAASIDQSNFNNVFNLFILPSHYGDENNPLLFHGIANIENNEGKFDKIDSYTLNSLVAMNLYAKNQQTSIKLKLFNYSLP